MNASAPRLWVWALLGAYICFLLPVLADFRAVMGDEACYADPALRYCEGYGFTSAAWKQSPKQLWAGNFPLHALSTITWTKLTGLDSLWGLRIFSLLLFVFALLLWTTACRRAGWFRSTWQEACFVLLVIGSLYATGPSQYIRPEGLGVALLAFALWSQTLSNATFRNLAAFLAGLLTSLAGLQFVVSLSLFGIVWLLLVRRRPWLPLGLCALGGLIGFILLSAFYFSAGVGEVFMSATFGAGPNRAAQWHGWRDPMLWATAMLLAIGLAAGVWPERERRCALAGMLAGPGLALVLFALSKFPQYYAALAVLPACTATSAVLPALPKCWRMTAFVFLLLAGIVGFPLAALMNWNLMPSRDYKDLERWTNAALRGKDGVFVDPSAYFAARGAHRQIYTQFVLSSLTSQERASIDTALLAPDHSLDYLGKDSVLAGLGGKWRLVKIYPEHSRPSTRMAALDCLSRLSYSGPYAFEVWERVR